MNHKRSIHNNNQQGFTIIELMIATAVFSMVLLIATVAVIMVTNSYVKGDIQSETQDTTRSVLMTLAQDVQFNTASSVNTGVYDGSQYGFFCIGNDVYAYQLNKEIGNSTIYHALLEFSGSCPSNLAQFMTAYAPDLSGPSGGGNSAHELLANNLRLEQLSVTHSSSGSEAYTITVSVAYGNAGSSIVATPASSGYTYSCPPESLGGQFCADSSLTTTVTPRIQ